MSEKFKDRREQRITTETMNALLLPMTSYLNDETKAIVEKALRLLNSIEIEQEPKTEWIPVSERLPAENITVIGITNFGDIYKSELYDDCGKKKWYADGDYDVPIVAWIPFPEPYKESEDK